MIEVTVDLQKDTKQVEFVVQCEHKHDLVTLATALLQMMFEAPANLEDMLRPGKEKAPS